MALTRKMLKAMGIEDEKIDQIIEEHTESTDALKNQRDQYKAEAEEAKANAEDLQAKVDELGDGDGFKAKYEQEHQAYEDFKAQVEADKAKAEKSNLYKKLLESAGVESKYIEKVMRVTDLEGVNVKDGTIQDADKLSEGIKEEWKEFIGVTSVKGADPATPPAGSSSSVDLGKLSMAEYIKARKG